MIPATSEARGTIFTFYSFKGGVGRSMALANAGALLAKWGFKVLVADWDLEAPGIERFFRQDNPGILRKRAATPGIIDLVHAKSEGNPLDWRECLVDVKIGTSSSRLSLLTAGQSGDEYTSRLHALDFQKLFETKDLGNYIEQLRDEWAAEFQFVLVDSRTGVTDIGGICTVHLADALVLLFTTTDSSTDGALDIVERARKAQQRLPRDRKRLLAIPVPARDESRTEYEKAAQWKQRFSEQFAELYNDWLPRSVTPREAIELLRIPYVPYWSFGEQLPAVHEGTTDPSSLGHAYEILALVLAGKLNWDEAITPTSRLRELDEIWLTKHRVAATERLTASGLPGFMEVCHFCLDSLIEVSQPDLLLAAVHAQIGSTDWPIGVVKEDDQDRPKSTSDGILVTISSPIPFEPGWLFDYWTLNKNGDFYTLRSLPEDRREGDRADKILLFNVQIIRAAEALIHAARLYRGLGVAPNARVEIRVRYGGLRDRNLKPSYRTRWIDYHGKNAVETEVNTAPIRFQVGAVQSEIVSLVKQLCAPLFIVFDFTEIPDAVYKQIIEDYLGGHLVSESSNESLL